MVGVGALRVCMPHHPRRARYFVSQHPRDQQTKSIARALFVRCLLDRGSAASKRTTAWVPLRLIDPVPSRDHSGAEDARSVHAKEPDECPCVATHPALKPQPSQCQMGKGLGNLPKWELA